MEKTEGQEAVHMLFILLSQKPRNMEIKRQKGRHVGCGRRRKDFKNGEFCTRLMKLTGDMAPSAGQSGDVQLSAEDYY